MTTQPTMHRAPRLTRADYAFGAVLSAIIVCAVVLLIGPKYTQLRALRQEYTAQEDARREIDQLTAMVAGADENIGEAELRLAQYQGGALDLPGAGSYLDMLARVQRECDIAVDEIAPAQPMTHGQYDVVPLTLGVDGTFTQAFCFLHRLERVLWSAELVEVTLASRDDRDECHLTTRLELYVAPSDDTRRGAEPAVSPGTSG